MNIHTHYTLHTRAHTQTHMYICIKFSGTASPMKKCQVPFDRYRNGLHVSFTSRPKVCIVISVKQYTIFLDFESKTHMHTSALIQSHKIENRSMLTHAHIKNKCTGQILSFDWKKKVSMSMFFLLSFASLFLLFWMNREKIGTHRQTNEESNLWFTLQRPFHYDLRRWQCK